MARRFVLKVYVSAKHMTANVLDWNHRRVVASASTVEKSISDVFELGRSCNVKAAASIGEVLAMSASTVEKSISDVFELGRSCNVKAAASIGEVLAMRLKTEEKVIGMGGGVHMDVEKEIEKKSVDTGPEVWAVVDALRKRGVKVFVENEYSVVGTKS